MSYHQYSPWRHGGWYVGTARYPSGAVGCVSRNYPDKKWRVVCAEGEYADRTYSSRDEAAYAEQAIAFEQWHIEAVKALRVLARAVESHDVASADAIVGARLVLSRVDGESV